MTKRSLSKMFSVLLVLILVFSFVACSDDAAVDPEEGETPDETTDPSEDLEEEFLPNTLAIPIHPELELVYSSDEGTDGVYAYTSDKKLETMFDFYNNMTIFTASANTTTTTDVFMVKTSLYEVIQEMGFYLVENETLGEWEEEFTEAYEESEGVLSVVGVRGGTEELGGILPDELQEFVPDEGCVLFFNRLMEMPE